MGRLRNWFSAHTWGCCFLLSLSFHAGGITLWQNAAATKGEPGEKRGVSIYLLMPAKDPAINSGAPEMPTGETPPLPQEKAASGFGNADGFFTGADDFALAPRPLYHSMPHYPESLRKNKTQGRVVLELGVDVDGNVVFGKIVRSSHPLFQDSVLSWSRKLKFHPARDAAGNPFRCKILLPVDFILER